MERMKESLYEILGVPRNAKLTDIGRAYNRHKAEMRSEHTPPDPRRAVLMREAFEVLSDPQKRAAYDASLRRTRALELPGGRSLSRNATAAALALVALAIAGAYYLLDRPAVTKPPRLLSEIQTVASLGVGRLQSIDLSGKAMPVGIAFTLQEGVMVTPCASLSPDAQLVVLIPPRSLPARVIGADGGNRFCRLEVAGGGSWPMTMSSAPPTVGQKVYAVDLAATGEVRLVEGSIKSVQQTAQGRVVEASFGVPAGAAGRPLLDAEGRVLAVATFSQDGKGQHVGIPEDWLQPERSRAAVPAVPAPRDEPAAANEGQGARNPGNITPERRERLEKAFRPPPSVPDDI